MNLSRIRELIVLSVAILIVDSAAVTQAQVPTAAVDVVGIKIGMPLKDAVAAIKADNAKLDLKSDTLTLEGFDQPFVTSVVADQAGVGGKDKEGIQLLVITPPNPQVVWGIRRIYTYSDQTRPSLDNTLAGLRKKYGPESVFVNPDPRDMTKNIVWVYDSGGKLKSAGEARALYLACDAYFGGHFGGVALNNDLYGLKPPAQCNSIILATASVQAGRSAADGATVVNNLIFQVANGATFLPSIDATRAVSMAAVKARETKNSAKVNQRGAPKL
jgi:hypothetical protein